MAAIAPTLYIANQGKHHHVGSGVLAPALSIGTTNYPVHLKMTAQFTGAMFQYQGLFQLDPRVFRQPEDLYYLDRDFQAWLDASGYHATHIYFGLSVEVRREETIDYIALMREFLDQMNLQYTYTASDPHVVPSIHQWSQMDHQLVQLAYQESAYQMDLILSSFRA